MFHPNLKQLSNSSKILLHKCPRKYELYKLTNPLPADEIDDRHTKFGSAVGLGTQELMVSGDINAAYLTVFRNWRGYIDDDEGESDKKTFWFALGAIDRFQTFQRSVLSNYRLAILDGKPAIEVGFSIDCGDGFYDRGFIDAVFIDTLRNELIVYEGKTTKFRKVDEASYKNSGQGLGYSIILDIISQQNGIPQGSSYRVIYCVYKTLALEWEPFYFTKSYTSRAMWIKNLLLDKQRVIDYGEDSYFPMYGENCFDFFRQCRWFGTCELSNKSLVGATIPDKIESKDKYQYHFSLDALIESQLLRHEQEEPST